MRLKEACKNKTKHRQCPMCKSRKGFILRYQILGAGEVTMDFKGKTLDSDRYASDELDNYAECANCGKSILTERLQTD